MSVTLAVDHERQLVTTVATGPISMADIRHHLDRERDDRGLSYREIIDASQATADFGADDVRSTVEILRSLGRRSALGPTAVIVSNDVTYGMFRMLEILLEDVADLRPFRIGEEAAAKTWLAAASIR